jgi:hypothetical protein
MIERSGTLLGQLYQHRMARRGADADQPGLICLPGGPRLRAKTASEIVCKCSEKPFTLNEGR